MGDYLSPRKQQVVVRLRERIEKVRQGNLQSFRIFEASNPQRREQERQDTQEFHRRTIENRTKRAPRNVKAQDSGQSKVKSETNGNCSNSEMGRNQPQVVNKKAVDRKRPNPDSPNLTGTTEAINRTSLEAGSSNSGMRGDASPAKKPCIDSKQLLPGHVSTPNNQYIQQQDPNRMGASHQAQLTDNGVNNQAGQGASAADGIEGVQGLDLLNDIGNTEDVMRLLDDPNGTQLLDEMMKSDQFNAETLLSELDRLENNLSMQLGEMPDIATNSPRSQDSNKQNDTKPDTASSNTEIGVVPKSENSDSYDPMMEGPPNTVATEALPKGGPLPSIHEFKPSNGKSVMIKQEPQQINASQAARAAFNGQNMQTAVSSGAQNIVPQVNQLTPMQATATTASVMNPSMRGSFVSQQSGVSGQHGNFLTAQQQQQLSSRQFLQNARMTNQQSHHSRMPNPVLTNNMNTPMSSADQLTQFANNSMRGQSPQHGRLPSMLQSFIQDRSQSMTLSSGQAGNMMPGQASQFVQHPQQQQRMASPEILQRLQNPPHYNANAEQRKFVTNSYVQSPQQGHNLQQGNNQMLIPRRPPPRYDETQHRNSMAFQSPVNQGMPQQLGQQGGMMTHMTGQPNIRSITPGQSMQGHPSNGMSASAGNLAPHSGMMQGMTQQQPQQQSMMHRLTPQIRRQILQQQQQQQQKMHTMPQSAAMGNQMNMGSVPPGAVNMGQAGVAQYQQRHLPGQWTANQLLQHRMQQQTNNFQGNNMMQQSYSTQSRFPQRNVMDSGSNMRTFPNITSQGGMSNVTNTNPSIMTQQQQFVGQPPQSQQQQTQQPTQQQQQQQQQQQGTMQQPVQGNSIAAMQNGSAVSGTNQTFGTNAQQMQMAMMSDNTNQQQSGSADVLDLLDNIIKNEGTARTNTGSHV